MFLQKMLSILCSPFVDLPTGPRVLNKVNMVGPKQGTHQRYYEASEGVIVKVPGFRHLPASGVDRPRVSPGFSTRNVPMPEGRPLLIPTGRSDCGGGDTVGDGTVGA